MSTQPVYGNNGYKNVQTSAGANVQYLNADTVNVSNLNVAETVSFFGASPVGQAGAIATLANNATGTQIATAVNSLIIALQNAGLTM